MNSPMKKCFKKYKFCIYARLALSLMITILAPDGPVVSVIRISVHKNGPLAMRLGPERLSWSGSATVAMDLGF